MQKVRRHSLILADRAPTVCKRPVSDLFHSPFGVLFTFPSRYLFAIGHRVVLRLGRWSSHVQTGFLVSRPTRILLTLLPLRGYHPLRRTFPDPLSSVSFVIGLIRFRSPLLTESLLMSFPPGT